MLEIVNDVLKIVILFISEKVIKYFKQIRIEFRILEDVETELLIFAAFVCLSMNQKPQTLTRKNTF